MPSPELTDSLRALARLSRVVETVCQRGDLSLPQYRMLLFLATESQHFGALASLAAVRPPTLTALVDALEAKGLVRRAPVEGDRRALQIELTSAGCEALTRTEAALAERVIPLVAASGTKDDFVRALGGVAHALDREIEEWMAKR